MSSNSTDTGTCFTESEFGALISPTLSYLMTIHTFWTFYGPLVAALFYFSTPQSRRRPVFTLNLVAIAIAFVNGIVVDTLSIHAILQPLNPWLPLHIVAGFLNVWQSMTIDLTLLFRLIAVYPPYFIGQVNFCLLITIPILLKFARAVNIFIFTKYMVAALNGPNPAVEMAIVFTTAPYIKIEWAAQMIDNMYASLGFLWRMRQHVPKGISTATSKVTVAQRMRTLVHIAASNFILPTLFSIAQFVCVYRNVSASTLNTIALVNTLVATFGVAFATVWAGSVSLQETQSPVTKNSYGTSRLMAIFGHLSRDDANQSSTVMPGRHESLSVLHEDTKV